MVKMIADRAFPYRGVPVVVGQAFEADEEHVELFKLIGHAHVPEGSQGYQTRVMTAFTGRRKGKQAA